MPKKEKSRRWLAGAALQNPVLVQAAGLTAVIVAANTLQGALIISIVTAVHLIICELLASMMKSVPSWLRVAIYFAIGLAIACPAAFLMDYLAAFESRSALTGALAPLRVFLPLMAVNALTATRCERYAILHTPGDALRDALANSLGFAAAALLVGCTRELLGYGSLWGVQLSQTLRIRGAWMPFGGFLLLGAMAALLKVILRALSVRGVYREAEKALELAPEDRLERLEKTRQLLIADVKEAMEMKNEEPAPEEDEEEPVEETEEEQAEEEPPEEEEPSKPHMPVDAILREYGLEEGEGALSEMAAQPLTEDEKLRLVLELEELLDDFAGPA